MANKKIINLGIAAATGTSLSDYDISKNDIDEAFRIELDKLVGTKTLYRKNKYEAFELMEEVADAVVPTRVIEKLGPFTAVKNFGDNERPIFKRKTGRQRAKNTFVTKAAREGVYETFRLDTKEFEIPTQVHGGAGRISLQDILTNSISLSDIMDIIAEGLVDAVYVEVQNALMASYAATSRPVNTKASVSAYDHQSFLNLINTVSAYGEPVVFTTKTFGSYMRPTYGTVANYSPNASTEDIKDLRSYGMIKIVGGAPIIALPQSFTDESNLETVMNPKLAYIFPQGGEKVIYLAFEGSTFINELKNVDASMEISAQKKFGLGIINHNNWAIYENQEITDVNWTQLGE